MLHLSYSMCLYPCYKSRRNLYRRCQKLQWLNANGVFLIFQLSAVHAITDYNQFVSTFPKIPTLNSLKKILCRALSIHSFVLFTWFFNPVLKSMFKKLIKLTTSTTLFTRQGNTPKRYFQTYPQPFPFRAHSFRVISCLSKPE